MFGWTTRGCFGWGSIGLRGSRSVSSSSSTPEFSICAWTTRVLLGVRCLSPDDDIIIIIIIILVIIMRSENDKFSSNYNYRDKRTDAHVDIMRMRMKFTFHPLPSRGPRRASLDAGGGGRPGPVCAFWRVQAAGEAGIQLARGSPELREDAPERGHAARGEGAGEPGWIRSGSSRVCVHRERRRGSRRTPARKCCWRGCWKGQREKWEEARGQVERVAAQGEQLQPQDRGERGVRDPVGK